MPENKYIQDELRMREQAGSVLPLMLNDLWPRSPIAYSRITRTPIVQGREIPGNPTEATYNDLLKRIVAWKNLSDTPNSTIRHESIHAANDGLDVPTLFSVAAKASGVNPDFYKSNPVSQLYPTHHQDETLAYMGQGYDREEMYQPDPLLTPSDPKERPRLPLASFDVDNFLDAYQKGARQFSALKAKQLQRLFNKRQYD
jgi:hypothetical protein